MTMAAGVNLPARVVIVRDLTLGVDEISSSELLQMAGRAGRPGLETQGLCYVLSPTEKLGTVQQRLEGRPIGSHISDDLARHINTEIVLGIIRSRSDAVAWYQRTLHAHLGDATLDPGQAVDALLSSVPIRSLYEHWIRKYEFVSECRSASSAAIAPARRCAAGNYSWRPYAAPPQGRA
jgi:hypothetical protein